MLKIRNNITEKWDSFNQSEECFHTRGYLYCSSQNMNFNVLEIIKFDDHTRTHIYIDVWMYMY